MALLAYEFSPVRRIALYGGIGLLGVVGWQLSLPDLIEVCSAVSCLFDGCEAGLELLEEAWGDIDRGGCGQGGRCVSRFAVDFIFWQAFPAIVVLLEKGLCGRVGGFVVGSHCESEGGLVMWWAREL